MSALILVFCLILFYTFISLSDGKEEQWYDAVNLCKQQGQILLPAITSNEFSFGYRQNTTMWTSSYILSVNIVKHTALYVEQIPEKEVHRGLCIDKKNSDKLLVLNIPLNYSYQDFKCRWDYIGSGHNPHSLLNITKLSVVREVIDVMDFGQKYWLSDISESVYSLVQQCEVFNYGANSTLSRKSYTAMRYCDDMNTYKCIDGKKYRTAVSLVKYLHHSHWNDHGRKRTNYSGGLVWQFSIIGTLGGVILIGLTVTCLIIKRSIGNLKREVQRLKQQRFEHPMYGTDQIQMIQSSVPEPQTPISPTGSSLYENFLNSGTSGESNVTVSYLTSTQVQRTVEVTETHNATSQDYSDGFSPHFLPPLKIPQHRPIIRHTSLVNSTDGQVKMLHCRQTSTEPASSRMFPLQHCLRGMPIEWFKTDDDVYIHGSTNSTNKPSPRPCTTNIESRVSSKSEQASALYLNTGHSADLENPDIEIDGEDYENIWEKNI
ncbi:uncharacterized protein LOC127730099 isoform X13 [Mytilus californianus]|uniref:uncharacterized protein LOC127730099 isoform X13 n=1 Tax=Mytilus californianus TaxID=6549 RepID=UPI002246E7C0|nr:uncharacterized protein LOC127730099 isoform X13 [Mytilus californianus]